MKFYQCKHCGNLLAAINDSGIVPVCCGDPMTILKANTVDGVAEKHVPVIERTGNKIIVKIGSIPHSMLPEHHIEWIALEYNGRFQLAKLTIDDEPKAEFLIDDPKAKLTAYEYCNIHGLWMFKKK